MINSRCYFWIQIRPLYYHRFLRNIHILWQQEALQAERDIFFVLPCISSPKTFRFRKVESVCPFLFVTHRLLYHLARRIYQFWFPSNEHLNLLQLCLKLFHIQPLTFYLLSNSRSTDLYWLLSPMGPKWKTFSQLK